MIDEAYTRNALHDWSTFVAQRYLQTTIPQEMRTHIRNDVDSVAHMSLDLDSEAVVLTDILSANVQTFLNEGTLDAPTIDAVVKRRANYWFHDAETVQRQATEMHTKRRGLSAHQGRHLGFDDEEFVDIPYSTFDSLEKNFQRFHKAALQRDALVTRVTQLDRFSKKHFASAVQTMFDTPQGHFDYNNLFPVMQDADSGTSLHHHTRPTSSADDVTSFFEDSLFEAATYNEMKILFPNTDI